MQDLIDKRSIYHITNPPIQKWRTPAEWVWLWFTDTGCVGVAWEESGASNVNIYTTFQQFYHANKTRFNQNIWS